MWHIFACYFSAYLAWERHSQPSPCPVLPATHEAVPCHFCCPCRQLEQGGYWVGKVQIKQAGVWCDRWNWSSCCKCVCWMVRSHQMTITEIIAVLHCCRMDGMLAYVRLCNCCYEFSFFWQTMHVWEMHSKLHAQYCPISRRHDIARSTNP